ncbi:MAG TPA: right-handed parallel beta-helix repeat-containing protein, partial [Phycisphaerales bacterium]|nr:right-handed parallel beta-helix repeat-containing protein [Phycisphaerales bacterium]
MKKVDTRAAFLAALALTACTAQATVIVVPTQQPTIQAGINAASIGDTVLVLNGTYTGTGNRDIDFLGKNITLQSQGGPQSCIIDVAATPTNQHSAFYLHMGETNSAIIQGFTVKRGWEFNGPGMLLFNSSPTVRNCVFTEHNADCWGGVVYFDSNSSPKFFDCRFTNNYSADDGGAVFGFNGSPEFTNCLFANNIAPSLGGAILTYGSVSNTPKLINCTITGNSGSLGAAIYSNNLIVENSIIWGNTGGAQQIYTFTGNSMAVRYSN